MTLIGEQVAGKIEFVCSAMGRPYLRLIAKHCPQALNILDRFHLVAKLDKALDEVRASEARRMLREGYEPVLEKKRWCLLERPENLTDKQRLSLRELLGYNLESVRAHLLEEEFQLLREYKSPAWATRSLTPGASGRCVRTSSRRRSSPAPCAHTGSYWSTTSRPRSSAPAASSRV